MSSMPYAGAAITTFNETIDAFKGEQSWEKAAADTAGVVGGSAVGAAGALSGYGAIAGSSATPIGGLVVGATGGVIGLLGGQEIADQIIPE